MTIKPVTIADDEPEYKKPSLSDLTFFDVTKVTVQRDPANGSVDITLWGTGRHYVEKLRITTFQSDLATPPVFALLDDRVPEPEESENA